jgi:hypothetical protein
MNDPRRSKQTNFILNIAILLLIVVLIVLVVASAFGAYVKQVLAKNNDPKLPERIKQSIRATFPTFCAGPNDELIVRRETIQIAATETVWTVSCSNHYPYPWPEPFVSIDIFDCSVRAAITSSPEWHQGYSGIFASTFGRADVGRLTTCP